LSDKPLSQLLHVVPERECVVSIAGTGVTSVVVLQKIVKEHICIGRLDPIDRKSPA
jgi:hypothetical protein